MCKKKKHKVDVSFILFALPAQYIEILDLRLGKGADKYGLLSLEKQNTCVVKTKDDATAAFDANAITVYMLQNF